MKTLCLSGNNIETKSVVRYLISKLRRLKLIGNEFKLIPDKLLKMVQLKDINFRSNPLYAEFEILLDEFGNFIKR